VGVDTEADMTVQSTWAASLVPPQQPSLKKARVSPDPGGASRAELVQNDENAWRPFHVLAPYKDGLMNERATLILLLPTGVASEDTRDVHFEVVEDGQVLMVEIPWPQEMTNPTNMKDLWPPISSSNEQEQEDAVLRTFAIKSKLAEMRPTAKDRLTAVARFELGAFPMSNEKLKLECVSNKHGMRLLVIDLEATKKSDYSKEDAKVLTFRDIMK
jgi:hypothetical protein